MARMSLQAVVVIASMASLRWLRGRRGTRGDEVDYVRRHGPDWSRIESSACRWRACSTGR